MKAEAAGSGGVGRDRRHDRSFQVSASLDLIADQMVRKAEQRMGGRDPDWIGHFLRDGLASSGDSVHSIETAGPPIKTVQLANEAELFDWIAKLLAKLQTSREGSVGLFIYPHRIHRGNSEARLQVHLLGSAAARVVQGEQRSL